MPEAVFLDTNVIIDLVGNRQPFVREAVQLFDLAEGGELELYASSLSIVNTYYVLRKLMGKEPARQGIAQLLPLVKVLSITQTVIEQALEMAPKDFEDGVQYFCASQNIGLSALISRNKQDFPTGKLAVMTPSEYLEGL